MCNDSESKAVEQELDTVEGLCHIRKLMNAEPIGTQCSKEEFDQHIAAFPRARRDNWGNGELWHNGMKVIASEFGDKYYVVKKP